ncbi:MAG: hypothetical protein H7Y17_14145 [Chlorobia bacterium]|nr:hypothetical protein [Fimbriimonadaceae bacterium]
MKIRSSAKIAIGFLAIVGGGYYGWQLYAGMTVDGLKFAPIRPSRVNIVGIASDSGYRVLVANHAAQLIRSSVENFDASAGQEALSDAAEKKRVPIREMLQALQGNAAALGQFIAIMNEMQETAEWPTERIIWKEGDLRKAISGDPVLTPKLEKAINVRLDGTPLTQISLTAHENGIIVETYVPCKVQVADQAVDMKGTIQIPYRSQISKAVARALNEKAYDLPALAGYYALEKQKIDRGEGQKEDVRKSLNRLIDAESNAELARPAQQVLKSATVVVTDVHIAKASSRNYIAGSETLNDLTIEMTDEGRKRLWQFSRKKVGSQLLLIVDGVAIAAPRIRHELAQGELQITQMPDKVLVQDAVDAINNKTGVKS